MARGTYLGELFCFGLQRKFRISVMTNRFCVFISIIFKVSRISEICEEGQVGGDRKAACGNSSRHVATGETSLRHTYGPKVSVLRRTQGQKLISDCLLLGTSCVDWLQYR